MPSHAVNVSFADPPAIQLEEVACSLCGSHQRQTVLVGPDRLHGVPGSFTLCRCTHCGLVYQTPRPTLASFGAIYPDSYPPHQSLDTGWHPRDDHVQATRLLRRTQPAGGHLLDVGCGGGDFLRVVRQQAPEWQTMGIDPGPQAVATARQAGLAVQQGTLETAPLPRDQWEAITLWHVLEHLPDPLGTLRLLRQRLAPGGRLYLAVPMCDSWDATLFGRCWLGWDVPRHFVLFDQSTLRALLVRAGFRIRHSQALGGAGSVYFVTESLRWLMQERISSYTLRRVGFALSYSRPFRLLVRPYVWLTAALKRSTELVVVAESAEHV